ncbi:DNA-binding anti-repressor SinI [Peribacillus alkalitolerans]|nr:DNA-binding anti-repressor SinI [Peribacillus alkalitolerans]
MVISNVSSELDQEWIELIIQAKENGINKEEIIAFLKQHQIQEEAI